MQRGLNTERRGEKNGRRRWGDENRKGLNGGRERKRKGGEAGGRRENRRGGDERRKGRRKRPVVETFGRKG